MSWKTKTGRWALGKHGWLALIGGISLLLWGLSGLTHIGMVLFGPQQAQFMPPRAPLDLQGTAPVAEMFETAGINRAIAVKTVAHDGKSLLQVTTDPAGQRRYFDPATGKELAGQDARQAEYLARYYLKEERPIASITLQTDFDADYGWVNRLLPVWKIRFVGDDRLTAYVHTETSSLAAVNNRTKGWLQSTFRALHSWEWVPPSMAWLKVVVAGEMVGSLAALALTGIAMLVTVRRRKRLPGAKGWHRVAGYILSLPLIMFSLSGIYHLVQGAIAPPAGQMRMAAPIDLSAGRFPIGAQWSELTRGLKVDSLSLVEGAGGRPLYRLGLARDDEMPKGEHDHGAQATPAAGADHAGHGDHRGHSMPKTAMEIRTARFEGVQPTGPALYIDAATGAAAAQGDREIARMLATRYAGVGEDKIADMRLVTRFGPDYDFRNKRLPVWRVDYAAPVNATLFVDTATGALADRVEHWQMPERYVFSFVHKWNFLFPLGKIGMNAVVGGVMIALLIFMGAIGLQLYLRLRRSRR
ncbi:MAG: PepSY domain-containing protein [Pseudomonadota bacterium]